MMQFMPSPNRAFLISLALCAAATSQTVRIESGQVAGTAAGDGPVTVYKGIPYAAPPTGDQRWRAPRLPAKWEGVRPATQFASDCMQLPYPASSIYHSDPRPVSEDCLYLNVWTSAASATAKRPVMVWIHGGALTRGSGATPTYDGEEFAKKGVVLVTINYRLGVFGFLAHPELTQESDRNASGNYGLLDQIAALEWVKQNIPAFGGDPSRVTIFGESAGAWSVNFLQASPLAKGLFHRVIAESGGTFTPMIALKEAEKEGQRLGASIKDLRAKPAEELVNTAGSFRPNVDGWSLPQDVRSIFTSGKQNDVPILVGSNADEGTSLAPWPANGKASTFVANARMRFKDSAEEFFKIYPADTDEQARSSHYASYRDSAFGWQMRTWARLQTVHGKSKAFMYYFDRVPPGPLSQQLGAYHAAEIAYVFGTLSKSKRPWEDKDCELSSTMSSYWINFATHGDPNGPGLPAWPAYSAKTDKAMELGDKVTSIAVPHKAALDFLDTYLR